MNETINFRLLHYCAQKGVVSNTHSQFEPATHPTGKSFNGRSHVFSHLYACDLSQYGKAKYFRMDDLAEQIRCVLGTPLPYEVDFAPDTSGRLSHLWSTPPQST